MPISDENDGSNGRDPNKTRTETPPPSYDEALAISSMISQQNPDPLYVNLSPSPPPPLATPTSPNAAPPPPQLQTDGASAIVLTTTAAVNGHPPLSPSTAEIIEATPPNPTPLPPLAAAATATPSTNGTINV